MKSLVVPVVVLLSLAGVAAAEEAPSPKSLVERAIEAHGGRDALAKWPSLERKGTSESLSGRGVGRRWDITSRERADGAYRDETAFEWRGSKRISVFFFDGRVAKRRFGASWDDMPVDESKELAAHRLPWLLALASAELKAEGEGSEADVPCWVVSAADGRDRAMLSFAKDDGRLVAMDYPGTQAEGMGTKKEIRRKLIFRDLRPVGSLKLPFDVELWEAGTPLRRLRWDSVRVLPEFDAEWIKLPDPTRRFIPSEELSF